MPARGKHRRPKSQRFTRSIAAAGTGGAALALPLIGATGANAATPVDAVAQKSTAVSQQKVTEQTEKSTTAKKVTTRTYSVQRGDYLAKIAREQNAAGGWKKIYADNREAIGSDPSLIHPGLKLTLNGKAPSSGSTSGSGNGSVVPSGVESPSSVAKKAETSVAKKAETSVAKKAETSVAKKAETSAKKPTSATPTTPRAASSSGSGFTLPAVGAHVGTAYKTAGSMWSSGYHTGVDFSMPTGTSLKAVGAGTVVSAGWGGAYGNQVVLRLADGHYAQYAHLSSLSVSAGQSVTAGQQVGLSGATGNVTGPHLHFEIRTGAGYGSDVDPLAYLRSKGVSI